MNAVQCHWRQHCPHGNPERSNAQFKLVRRQCLPNAFMMRATFPFQKGKMAIRIPGPRKRERGREEGREGALVSLLTAPAPPSLLTTGLLSAEISLPPSLASLSLSLSPGRNSEILLFSGYKSSLTHRSLSLSFSFGWADSALLLTQSGGWAAGAMFTVHSLRGEDGREERRVRGDRLWAGKRRGEEGARAE